jgi:pimeloyl-ACP methyl ester carboxylesterase
MLRSIVIATLMFSISVAASGQSALELSACRINAGPGYPSIDARCGTIARPLDPADPESSTIDLNVAVVPALSLEPEPDPLVPIAGGPGQSTVFFYASLYTAFERVRRDRDILLIDQRGTGDSASLTCAVDDDIVEGKYSDAQTLRAVTECLEELPHDPRFFTTSIAVTDLEAVRKALNYSALNLYGISYGTRVAQHYARRYPDSTRTVIIDGVVPPQLPLGPDIAIESQRAIDRVFDRCSNDADCRRRFPTVRDDFDSLQAALKDTPVFVELADPLTAQPDVVEFGGDQLGAAVRLLLYDPRTIALLPLLIDAAANGNYVPLTAQFQMVVTSLTESLSIGMHNAVMCTEDVPFIDWGAVDYEALDGSYLGPLQLEAIRTMCSVWPVGVLDPDLREPLSTDVPVLLLSGEADPITPPAYAELAAASLSRAWLLTGRNQGHGLISVGCVPRILAGFVTSMALEDNAADCLADAFAMPFFIDFSGPMP